VVVVPVLLLFLCMGLGLWGIFAASGQERRLRVANAQNRGADKAQTIESELRASYLPVKVGAPQASPAPLSVLPAAPWRCLGYRVSYLRVTYLTGPGADHGLLAQL
jgi:hypothetical protein